MLTTFVHHSQGVSYHVWKVVCTHRNMYLCCKKQIIINKYIVHLLDKDKKIYKMHGTYCSKIRKY